MRFEGFYDVDEFYELYPMLYGHGVSEGMRLAFEAPVSDRLEDQRGRLCPCQGDQAVHRGFRAGWTSVRRVSPKRLLGK